MAGYFRVINFRGDRELGPEPDETVIDLDRSHPTLGNEHRLKNPRDSRERAKVIAANESDLDRDFLIQGPKYRAILEIAKRVEAGEKICGRCWCKPLQCHVDGIAVRIDSLVKKIQLAKATPNSETTTSIVQRRFRY